MGAKSESMDYWRRFFRSTNSNIFEVIEQAIEVAAADCPKEFRRLRDRIAEKLFTCQVSRCFGCNKVEVRVPDEGEHLAMEEGGASVKREVGEKSSKANSCNGDQEDLNRRVLSNYSYDEAEALTVEMDEESELVGEVLRLKEVLNCNHEESDEVLYDSLRRLQLMQLSVETLKATEVGRAVNGLRKHNSKKIRGLVRTLIEGWKVLVDEWVDSAAAISHYTPDSVNLALADNGEGLPLPPMDEGALLATQTTSIELSQFFDGLDDDGNLRTFGDSERPIHENHRSHGPVRRQEPPRQPDVLRQAKPHAVYNAPPRPQGIVNKSDKPSTSGHGVRRPSNQLSGAQRKPSNIPQDKSMVFEDVAASAKLEVAKRKLHEGYQQAEKAKRQRTIQMVEIHELPKEPPNQKFKNQSRNWRL